MLQSVEALLALATVASAAVSLFVNFVYQEYIRPSRDRRRARRDALTKVGMPLLRATKTASSYVDLFLRERRRGWYQDDSDGIFRLSLLYALAEVFGWARRIEEDAFIDIAPPEERAGAFHVGMGRVFQALTGLSWFRDLPEPEREAALAASVPRRALQAVGELMIVRERAFAEDEPRLMQFHAFVERYETDAGFRRWMDAMGAPFLAAERDQNAGSLARVAILANMLNVFSVFLERYLDVQSVRRDRAKSIVLRHTELIPPPALERLLREHAKNTPPVQAPKPREPRAA